MEKGDKPLKKLVNLKDLNSGPKVKISRVKKEKVKKSKKPKEKKPKKARSVKRAKKTKKMIGADSKPMGAENPAEYKQPSRQMMGTTASGGGMSNFTGQVQIKAPEVKPKRKYTKKPKMEAMAPAPAPAPAPVQQAPVKRGRGRPLGSGNASRKPDGERSKNATKETGKISEIMYLEPKERKAELKEQELKQQATPTTKKELGEILQPLLPSAEAPKEEKRPRGRPKKEKMIVEEKPLASKKSKKSNNTFLSDATDFLDIEQDEPFNQAGFLNSINQVEGTLGQEKKTTMKSKTYKSSSSESGFSEVEKITRSGFQDQNNLVSMANNSLTDLMNENIKDGPDMVHNYENQLQPSIDPSEVGDEVYPEYYDLPSAESSSSSTKKRGRPKGSKNQPKNVI